MNITCIILTVWAFTRHIAGQELYCTKSGTWIEAMNACVTEGGVPLSYSELMNTTEPSLKTNVTVWTREYIHTELVTSIPDGNATGYECGYITLKKDPDEDRVYYPSEMKYTSCDQQKYFFCNSDSIRGLRSGILTWQAANQACLNYPSFKLWSGFSIRSISGKDYEGTDMWVLAARQFTTGEAKDFIGSESDIVWCGTNNLTEISFNDNNNLCTEEHQAVCRFDNMTFVSENFTKSCFEAPEESTTESIQMITTSEKEHRINELTKDNSNQTRLIMIVSISASVVVCFIVALVILILVGRKRRRSKPRKLMLTESSGYTVSTLNGVQSSSYSNGVAQSYDADDEYSEVYDNNMTNTGQDDSYIMYALPEKYRNNNNVADDVLADDGDSYTVPETDNENEDVYAVPNKVKARPTQSKSKSELTTQSNSKTELDVESEYDTTNNIKVFNESTNIYNKLGCDFEDSVYDNNTSNKDNAFANATDKTYSTTGSNDTYDTTNTKHTAFVNVTDNTYSTATSRDTNKTLIDNGVIKNPNPSTSNSIKFSRDNDYDNANLGGNAKENVYCNGTLRRS